MYGPFDTLDTDSEYDPDEEWDPDFYLSEPDPDDARDRMIEDERWDGVS